MRVGTQEQRERERIRHTGRGKDTQVTSRHEKYVKTTQEQAPEVPECQTL